MTPKAFHHAIEYRLRSELGEAYHDLHWFTRLVDGWFGIALHDGTTERQFLFQSKHVEDVCEFLDVCLHSICHDLGVLA